MGSVVTEVSGISADKRDRIAVRLGYVLLAGPLLASL